jgi:hypothetical protein
MTKKILVLSLILSALTFALAQNSSFFIPIWNSTSNRYNWIQIGSTLSITNGILNVVPSPVAIQRSYNTLLTKDSSGNYPLPANAVGTNIVVTVNGLRYNLSEYSIVLKVITPNCTAGSVDCNWPVNAVIVVDYDRI